MDKLEIEYALAKQVPDMARGFTIATSYGELHVSAVDAPVVMKVVRDLLESELERAKAHVRQEANPEQPSTTPYSRQPGVSIFDVITRTAPGMRDRE
ncbi:hypothetical protein JQS64_28665 [Pseudomonas aeruginosa]|uniref:hypothetical protein n=1 Tax=Pseudomonas aeruginosa TaxID=287 RepID=UPI0012D8E6D9|nr:hypothetical protein [Pseudomonas aeruginosa]MBH9458426.1 hypothetical protein [Pseudomonas aeruginosa]MBH9463611.1 hypothetical protein [Pseudomonas aeruginosa]MBM2520298.1 hypothetical protein [Pseudomonas aeruginosa]MUI51700.1 hypothetical protein [Pseudomonas aeruginosa]HCL3825566.1 hypothetical protein [Pseudomonas aeruginosa]